MLAVQAAGDASSVGSVAWAFRNDRGQARQLRGRSLKTKH